MSGIFHFVFSLCYLWTSSYEFNLSQKDQEKIYKEPITIPTYLIGESESNPVLYTPRNYQGAQLRVYPYPYMNNLTEERVDKEYNGLIIENKYIKICILLELGGRLDYAVDKTNQYDFIGKKFRNWGNNDIARFSDEMLTDEDSPYLELLKGMYSDNQPDCCWNDPQGIRSGTMYHMPIRNLNSVKNTIKEMAFNLEAQPDLLDVKLFVDRKLPFKKS